MKRTLLLITFFVVLSNCEVKPVKVTASTGGVPSRDWDVYIEKRIVDGIEYHFWNMRNKEGIFVINHTKELLETELLKVQLQNKRIDADEIINK